MCYRQKSQCHGDPHLNFDLLELESLLDVGLPAGFSVG